MATTQTTDFIKGNGEMASLIRSKDWSQTALGDPQQWSPGLRITLNLVLQSRFPMFLWWGKELTGFYNDAYRVTLGDNGKHPGILGETAETAWPEAWTTIKPLLDQVLAGGSTWSEDQLVPIFRNGKLEDVYWTFSYSPVMDENGEIAGVLSTCTDTTEKILSSKLLINNNKQYINDIMQAPVAMCILRGKQKVVEIANEAILELWGKTSADVINKPIFEGLPEASGQGLEDLLDNVLTTGESFIANERPILLPRNGTVETTYINFVYKALRDLQGDISGIVVIATDVSFQVQARQKLEDSDKLFRNTVKQVPMGITILTGPDFVVEMANEMYLELVDRSMDEFVGKPLFDSLPEVKDIVDPLLTGVLDTGVAFHASELSVTLNRYGKSELGYFNLIYHPLRGDDGKVAGIIVVASEVTDSVKARFLLSESEKHFRNLVLQSPIAMVIFRGKDYVIDMANKVMLGEMWLKTEDEVIGKKLLDVFPELAGQKYPELLDDVYTSGRTHRETESIAYVQRHDGLKKFYLDFEYTPFYDTDGSIDGIIATVNNVTEKVEARKKVEEAEERLRLATEAAQLATWDIDLQTKEVIYSPRFAKIFGHDSVGAWTHEQMRSQIHPDDFHTLYEPAYDVAMSTGIYWYETRIIKAGNEIAWIRVQGQVFYGEDGSAQKMIGTLRDITDEKLRQQELIESEQKFRLLADSMPQFIWTADAKGCLTYFNQSVYNYSGLSPEYIKENGWIEILHPYDRAGNRDEWKKAIETGSDFELEHRFRRKDGDYRWHFSRAFPQKDNDGNIQMWVGSTTDIQDQKTFMDELERKVAERTKALRELNVAFRKSEERYHLMVEEIQDYAIIYLNTDGIVENWNKGAEKIKGYLSNEIVGRSFSIFYNEDDRAAKLPFQLLEKAAAHGRAVHQGWRVRKDGGRFWANVVITAVHDDQHNLIGFSKVTHDLTDKKEADDRLRLNTVQIEQKNKELEGMNAELQSFAYVASHDLQEPLRKIQTFASRIMERELTNLSDYGKDYFTRMQSAAKRMQILIEDLLAYSRASTTERIFETISLDKIVAEVKSELKDDILQKQAIIESDHLGEAKIIHFQFRQLLYNLVGNALKFTKPGEPPVVKIRSHIDKAEAFQNDKLTAGIIYRHISIADNGIGFEDQYKQRIFEVFQRLHARDDYQGTGIGLAIVKKIVENHHGIISASGKVGEGACFDIYLPVQ